MRRCARRVAFLGCAASWPLHATTGAAPSRSYATTATRFSSTASSSSSPSPSSSAANGGASRRATDAELERDIMRKAMAAPSATNSADLAGSVLEEGGIREERIANPGTSADDAFGHVDPLSAVEETVQEMRKAPAEAAEEPEKKLSKEDIASELDAVVSGRNRRRNRRKQTMDTILGDVLHDALLMRDMGEKPTADFVYKRAQERMYEEEYGKKPSAAKETAEKSIPFPPDFHLRRLLPLFGESAGEAEGQPSSSKPVQTRNHMHTYVLALPDPWPERAITPENPVWSRRAVEQDKEKTGGKGLKEWEEKMYAPRPGYDLDGEFLDAMDELAHWELQMLTFLRQVPISQRRSLPFLHEWYRFFVHRVLRAERRYTRVRDVLLKERKASTSLFARTELVVDSVRAFYSETHRALASPNYDVFRMKKSALAPILRMTDAEFVEWQEVQRQKRNALAAELA